MASTCTFPLFLSVTLQLIIITLASTSSSEADILLSFRASVEDPSRSLSTWSSSNSSSSHCSWAGVACSLIPSTSRLSVTSIDLQSFNLSGEISPSICELQSLTELNLAGNLFKQPIPLHLSECSSLQVLNLSNNLIWGPIPEQVSGFRSLRVLDLSRNGVEGKIPESIGLLRTLQVLNLGGNLLSGTVPSSAFGNLTELTVLDLSLNPFLTSEIPSEIWSLKNLEKIFLQSCGFYGVIPDSIVGLQKLTTLDLSENNLTGKLPTLASLKNLASFDVSQNRLSGAFPDGVCAGNGLISLSLHTNFFNGSLLDAIGGCRSLERFQVQNNEFHGDFPSGLWSLPKIKIIRAENNQFSGEIPDLISTASQLEQVQIDNNSFTGKIPQGLGLVKSLYRFSASMNRLLGEIPPNFCDSPVMSILNLSHNALSGEIPELKKCRKLVSLSLADNSLSAGIPESLADLPVLTYLDLSANKLSGPIPQELQNLKLALFNVSFNQLSGRVPALLISGLPASFLEGNPGLCGPGLPNSCSDFGPRRHRDGGLTTLACALISIAFGIGLLIFAAGFLVYRKSSKQKAEKVWHSVFFYPLRITEQDLIAGMNEKSAVRTCGVFGRVYILSLPSGELVAVKILVNFRNQSPKTLKSDIKTLAKIRHKSIAKILGFCHSDDTIFMIYEYLPGGSLGDLIGGPDFELRWSVRLRIAIGVAQGLAYLHKDYVPHLIHRDIKSNNILLDSDCVPKLTDFALDRIVGEAAFQTTVASESASSCYNAPESGYSKRATEQMDVYSFGVVLLELVTGRKAEEEDSADSLDIVKWVRRKINITNGAFTILDSRVSGGSERVMLGALDIALRCTSVMPEKRPSMPEVVKALQSLCSGNSPQPLSLALSSSEGHQLPV
ncbi:probably inactive leucine-rich repeat receptor-like protein kinase At5g06940 [Punica granatum]|uniref:Probably inactive leucine-rich repeat receptor-like protein kinase At5g06940 n=2 Tax=Punica granatum TaxID=22663 RepID=A0A6P8DPA5_PUNGR|nr:probably inactive leucine-rich repeat receptor-like protein kinase At5g06940 [Punica granatum]PKI47786.1 hypothetical protein CRG98_031815 [Punica granatum]